MAESAGESGAEKAVSDSSLRHVEKDVLISKMIRKKSHEICFEPYVRGTTCIIIILKFACVHNIMLITWLTYIAHIIIYS